VTLSTLEILGHNSFQKKQPHTIGISGQKISNQAFISPLNTKDQVKDLQTEHRLRIPSQMPMQPSHDGLPEGRAGTFLSQRVCPTFFSNSKG
jgi:hypothetical protein